jgi:murein DD-endopeptidase MepM/ murein hydrolase activator NlpD
MMSTLPSMLVLLAFGGRPGGEPPAVYAPTFDGPPIVHDHDHPRSLRSPADPALAGPPLEIPWMCGQVEYCTQGHNGGSHTGTSSWAWDFAQQDGEEIWAASAGVVTHLRMNMTDGGCDSAYSGTANYITVDHGDGTSIVYLHMQPNTSPLAVGEAVEAGDLVARVGATGYACGAHLHMQVQETCGSYYCQSVPASFVDDGDPSEGVQYQGSNCPACPIALDGGETIVDDEDAGCFVRQTTAWWSSYQGHGDHHFWTTAIAAGASDSSALWRFGVNVPGDYAVDVFVPDADAGTTNARYQVHHEGGTTEVVIDQSTQKGWQALGTYAFAGGEGEGIELGDNTGEDVGLGVHVGFDAIRLTFVPATGSSGGDETGMGSAESGGVDPSAGSGGDTGTGGGGVDTGGGVSIGADGSGSGGSGGGGGTDDALPQGYGEGESGDGCACRPGSPAGHGRTGALLLVVIIAGMRRRVSIQRG